MMKKILTLSLLFLLPWINSCDKDPTGPSGESGYQWNFSAPEAQGMKIASLDSAMVQARQTGFIDALLVIRNGYIVAEQYYNGFQASDPHNVKSDSKSFLSALVGIALDKGYIESIDEKMLDYFPEYVYAGIDTRKYDITIRHLLTMRMGIEDESFNNYEVYSQLYHSNNWVKTTIEYPLSSSPGEKMRYNTFQTHLLSVILTKATGMSTLEFAQQFLADPMDISIDAWERDPQGYYFGGNSMYFTPREMAVLGYLYMNDGKLNDIQMIPHDWIVQSLSPSTASKPNEWGAFTNYQYASLWWLGEINGHHLFMAYGYGGQFIVVFPGLNLIVVSTAKGEVDPDTSTTQEWAIFDIISKYILPAVIS